MKAAHKTLSTSCTEICIVDFRNQTITLDPTLSHTLKLPSPQLAIDAFLRYVIPQEREGIKKELEAFEETKKMKCAATFKVGDAFYTTELQLTESKLKEQIVASAKGRITIKYITHSLQEKIDMEHSIWEKEFILDNLDVGLLYVNKDYIVQWESNKNLRKTLSMLHPYAVGETCYRTAFKRDEPCVGCPLIDLFCGRSPTPLTQTINGSILQITAKPIFNKQGVCIAGVLKRKDSTEEREKERALTEAKDFLEFSHTGSNMLPWEISPKTRAISAPGLEANGYKRRIPIGIYIKEYIHADYQESFSQEVNRLLIGQQDTLDIKIRSFIPLTHKEKMEWIHIKGKTIWREKGEWRIFGIQRIITKEVEQNAELIRLRSTEESNRLQTLFLANMSHEIRTPLNGIIGFTELIMQSTDNKEKEEYIRIIQKNNTHLLQIVSDILDHAKIDSGTLEFTYDQIDINELCQEIMGKEHFEPKSKVPVFFEPGLERCVMHTDGNRIGQALSKLIHNALKFTEEGEIKVGYHILNDTEIEFYVQDTGIGIAPEHIDKLFKRFTQVNSFSQGSGLGLSICKNIVTQMNGTVGVKSEIGKGSKFWFRLPYEKCIHRNQAAQEYALGLPANWATTSPKKQSILVAENIEINYFLLQAAFRKDFNLLRAHDGLEAIELFKAYQPEFVFINLKGSRMNGFEVISAIKSLSRSTPIIGFTSFSFDPDKQKAKEAGCDDFLPQPLSITQLKETLHKHLEKKVWA